MSLSKHSFLKRFWKSTKVKDICKSQWLHLRWFSFTRVFSSTHHLLHVALFVCVCVFHVAAVAFKIYDMDKDGYISNGELFQVLKMMVGNNLKDAQLQQIVDKTIIHADTDGDGKISFEEFCAVGACDKLLLRFANVTRSCGF